MKTIIDTDEQEVVVIDGDKTVRHKLATEEAFDAVAKAYLRAGWDNKYVYSFTWMGRPIIQLPDDMVRAQELIYAIKPDILVEIGVAHGGSLVFYASLMEAMGKGRVIGVDIEIRAHNRKAIEAHEMAHRITLIEGDSVASKTVSAVRSAMAGGTVMVFLDGKHTRDHVLRELALYAPMVTPGSYILAMDGIQKDLVGAPRSQPDWDWNNSTQAAQIFVAENPDFELVEPEPLFNEGTVAHFVTYWPGAYIRRRS